MVPAHLPAMLMAEVRTVFHRFSSLGAMAISLIIGVLAPLILLWIQNNASGAEINGASVNEMMSFSAERAGGWALSARHFFILPLLLLLATGSSLAGELEQRTLREAMVRAVPRWSLIFIKVVALLALSVCCLLLTMAPSVGIGYALFGPDETIRMQDVLLGYFTSIGADLGIISFGLLASTFVRSVGGVVVSVVLLLIFDYAARTLLWAREQLMGFVQTSRGETVEDSVQYSQLLPGAALEVWQGYSAGWTWEPFVGLLVLILVCLGLATVRFQRMDIL